MELFSSEFFAALAAIIVIDLVRKAFILELRLEARLTHLDVSPARVLHVIAIAGRIEINLRRGESVA